MASKDGFYPIELIEERGPEGNPVWLALHPTLPGCNATGRTQLEATANLDHAREAWLKVAGEEGFPIPDPQAGDSPAVLVQYFTRTEMNQRTKSDIDEDDPRAIEKIEVAAAK